MNDKLSRMRIHAYGAKRGAHQVPATVILAVLDARTDEAAKKAAASVRKVASGYDSYSGESDDALRSAWATAGWPDEHGELYAP